MAIKGLTDRAPAFPQIGTLRKGSPRPASGKAPGRDLDHFRFDTDDQLAAETFADAYGAEPRRINVYLPYETVEQSFDTCQEAWTASALQHRCDGETCSRWLRPDGGYSTEPKSCPGGCKAVGRLKVIVPELRRMVYVVVETHSIHDIIALQEQLTALEALRGSLRGIPLILGRSPREISTPRSDGQRVRVTKHLLHIEAAPSWVDLQLAALEQQARASLGAPTTPLALPAPSGHVIDVGTGEIAEPALAAPSRADLVATLKAVHEYEKGWIENAKPLGQKQVAAMDESDLDREIRQRAGKVLEAFDAYASQLEVVMPRETRYNPQETALEHFVEYIAQGAAWLLEAERLTTGDGVPTVIEQAVEQAELAGAPAA